MTRTRATLLVAALVTGVDIVACTAPPPPAVEAPDTREPTATRAADGEVPADLAPSRVDVRVFDGVSRVTAGPAGVGPSSVQVRVDQLLSELGAAPTADGDLVTLPEAVLFEFDSATLKPDAAPTLDRLAEAAVLAQGRPVEVRGHTDSRGTPDYNLDLSRRRAQAVADYLAGRGLDRARLQVDGFGETRPVAANDGPGGVDDPAGRERNRRVEVLLRPAG